MVCQGNFSTKIAFRNSPGFKPKSMSCVRNVAFSEFILKKTPALTLPQAQRLVAATFPLNSLTLKGTIKIIKYHTRRNYVAYISHRKKTVAKAKALKRKLSL